MDSIIIPSTQLIVVYTFPLDSYISAMDLTSTTVVKIKGSSINYVIADRGGGVSSKDYGIT